MSYTIFYHTVLVAFIAWFAQRYIPEPYLFWSSLVALCAMIINVVFKKRGK